MERASSLLRRCERRSGGAGCVFGDDLLDAAREWKLVPNVVLQLPQSRARGGFPRSPKGTLLQLGCNTNLKVFDPML